MSKVQSSTSCIRPLEEALVAAVVGSDRGQRVHHAREGLDRGIEGHDPGVEVVRQEEVGAGSERAALEEIVDVLQDEGVGIQDDDPIELRQLPRTQLREDRGEARKEQLPRSRWVGDRFDVSNAPSETRELSRARRPTSGVAITTFGQNAPLASSDFPSASMPGRYPSPLQSTVT